MGLRHVLFGCVLASALVACGNPPVGEPPVAGDLEEDETSPSAISLDGRGTFYSVRTEGEIIHVRRLNSKNTRCAEGDEREECRVSTVHYPVETPTPAADSIFRGTLALEGDKAVFTATEVWSPDAPQAGVSKGTFYRVEHLEILCARAPCPSFKQAKLNSPTPAKFLQTLAIDPSVGTEPEREAAVGDARSSALIVVGTNTPKKEGLVLDAVQYFRRVDAPATPALTDP